MDFLGYTITDINGDRVTKTVKLTVDGTSRSDSGDALGTVSIILLMLFTGMIGLYYVRREEKYTYKEK